MTKSKYLSVTLPEDLLRLVDTVVAERPNLGYSSRAEFVKDSIRIRINEVFTPDTIDSISKYGTYFEERALPDLQQIYNLTKFLPWFEEIPHEPLLENIALTIKDLILVHDDTVFSTVDIIKGHADGIIEFRKAIHEKRYGDPLSKLKNGKTTRLKDLSYDYDQKKLTLTTQPSTYYDNVVTNFSTETWIGSWNQTIRDKLEPGPKLQSLPDSLMGNQIGTGAMIITKDNYLILQHRSAKTMVNSFGLARSVGGSAKYIQSHFTKGMPNPFQTVLSQAHEELSLSDNHFEDVKLVGITRDIELAGKPYFFFITRINLTQHQFKDNIKKYPPIDAWEYDQLEFILLPEDSMEKVEMLRKFCNDNLSRMSSPTRTAFYFLEQSIHNKVI